MDTATHLHEVAITAIIKNEGKYLLIQRSARKKRFPSKWTVPGGRLEPKDYIDLPKDTTDQWYNVLERTLRREVKEEVNLEIENIDYLTSITMIDGAGIPVLIISCIADYASGKIVLETEESQDYAWVSLEEAKEYDLIEGIYHELELAEAQNA